MMTFRTNMDTEGPFSFPKCVVGWVCTRPALMDYPREPTERPRCCNPSMRTWIGPQLHFRVDRDLNALAFDYLHGTLFLLLSLYLRLCCYMHKPPLLW